MPRTPESFQELRDESRARILEAALRVFVRRGYEGATVREIAREAGVSQGLMYNYFEGKLELLRAIFLRGMEDVASSLRPPPPGTALEEALALAVRGAFRIVRQHLAFWRLSYGLRFQPGVLEGLGEEVAGWSGAIRATLEEKLRALGEPDPERAALALFAAIDGAAQHFALDPERYPLEEVGEALIARFRPSPAPRPTRTEGER